MKWYALSLFLLALLSLSVPGLVIATAAWPLTPGGRALLTLGLYGLLFFATMANWFLFVLWGDRNGALWKLGLSHFAPIPRRKTCISRKFLL